MIAAELIGATNGLGFLIYQGGEFFRSDRIIGRMLILGIIWMATDLLMLSPLERRTVRRWGTLSGVGAT